MTSEEAKRDLNAVLQEFTLDKVRKAREAVIVLHEMGQRPFNVSTRAVLQAFDTFRKLLIELDQGRST